jgi:ALG11 mannosyltransferase N-terminus
MAQICIYCEASDDVETLLATVEEQFGFTIGSQLTTLPLAQTSLLWPHSWPRFTMLGQTIGSIIVTWQALTQLVPEVCKHCCNLVYCDLWQVSSQCHSRHIRAGIIVDLVVMTILLLL